ncbi:MAG TPA: ParB/RepB/Spo0J family partition protein [Roseiflexaceae bacterium]|nr:ParB/RepB/Spo0J family partition protein [Roseiflexaceae bacterium]HMP39386.1 ParB/RepB/Spo0J family partition protein [Roseiflexaceae bacterium]
MNRRRGLGSGLDALLPADRRPEGMRTVALDSIRQNSRQPRTIFDETALNELAASIREHGIIQPLIVSERSEGHYELIAGERRLRAAERAGLQQVPILVRETTPQQLLELALIENVQRADLNPLEEAHAYQALKDEFGLSDEEIARRLGINSRVTIANTRRLLKLPSNAQQALLNGRISAGHGRALLKIEDHERQQAALQAITDAELSVRQAEQLGELLLQTGDVEAAVAQVRGIATERPAGSVRRAGSARHDTAASPDDQLLQRELEEVLQTPVQFVRSGREVRLTITFYDDEKLNEFLEYIAQR